MPRTVLIAVAAAGAIWLSLALTMSTVFATRDPALALRWWPWSSTAGAREAAHRLEAASPTQEDIAAAQTLGSRALAREPANAAAARDLGLVAAVKGDETRARRMFAYSERLSRRDVPTQMWLIETNVQQGNVVGALKHYDRLMRTSVETRPTLIPIMVEASQNPEIARALAPIVQSRPNWWPLFADAVIGRSRNAQTLAVLLPALHLDLADPAERTLMARGLRHMVDLHAIPAARDLYLRARKGEATAQGLVRDGGFETDGGLPPFEWQFTDTDGRQAIREPRDGAQGRYALSLRGDVGGEAARQLLALAPGRYRLSGIAGSIPGDAAARPSLSIVCATGAVFLNLPLAPTASPASFAGAFQVPRDCSAQWIFVIMGGTIDPVSDGPWIDSLRIQPL